MDTQKRITDLFNIENEDDRKAGIKLVTKIYGNIIKEPNNPKYKDLNFVKIRKKFTKCKPCLYLLFSAGFQQNIDGSRLILDTNNILTMKMLREANDALLAAIANGGPITQNNDDNKDNNNNTNNNDNNSNDVNMEDNNNNEANNTSNKPNTAPKVALTEEERQTLLNDGLNADDLELLDQIKKSKDTTVSLTMDELKGLTKQQKQELFKKKQEQYRKEKKQNEIRNKLAKEQSRRENAKLARDAERKRKEQELQRIAQQKKRDKELDKLRKKKIRDKIAADKARKKREQELRQQNQNNNQQQ